MVMLAITPVLENLVGKEDQIVKNLGDEIEYCFQFRFYMKTYFYELAELDNLVPLSRTHGWSKDDISRPSHARKQTYWNYQKIIYRNKDFFNYSIQLMEDILEKERDFKNFIQEEAVDKVELNLVIGLMGNTSIGDIVSKENLNFLIRNNIILGVEYFKS